MVAYSSYSSHSFLFTQLQFEDLQAAVTTADVATAIEETVGLRPGSVSAAEARGIVDFEVSSLEKKGDGGDERC